MLHHHEQDGQGTGRPGLRLQRHHRRHQRPLDLALPLAEDDDA
ncbi:hypothetical protein NKH77_31820 [Streptomyces sp. M19]